MTESKHTKGRFVWNDLMTREPDKARKYYSDLMSWSVEEMDMSPLGKYTMFIHKGQGLGGVIPLQGVPGSIPSQWLNYISVEDVDRSCAQAKERAGKIFVEPFDIPTVGRAAGVEDPTGAIFYLFRSEEEEEIENKRGPQVGEFCWYEVASDGLDTVKEFYKTLFGWTLEKTGAAGPEYWVAMRDGERVCGLMRKPEHVPRSHWLSYLLVDNVERAADRAVKLGGKTLMGPMPVPGIGRFTVILDGVGAAVALFESENKA